VEHCEYFRLQENRIVINHGFNHSHQVNQRFRHFPVVIWDLFFIHYPLISQSTKASGLPVHQKYIGTIKGYNDQIPILHRDARLRLCFLLPLLLLVQPKIQ